MILLPRVPESPMPPTMIGPSVIGGGNGHVKFPNTLISGVYVNRTTRDQFQQLALNSKGVPGPRGTYHPQHSSTFEVNRKTLHYGCGHHR